MIIDAHIHYAPPELQARLDQFTRDEPYWGLLMGPESPQGWASADRMIADMDRAGIDKVVIMGQYRRRHEGCVEANNEALALMRRYPGRVLAFAMAQPKQREAALDELARCWDAGMVGVGELGPYGQGYRLDDPDFLALVERCIEFNLPVNLHTNEEVGRYYAGKAATPLRHIYRLAERYPELKLILAHWGGGLLFNELMPAAQKTLRNVWYDTAASPLLFPTERIFRAALAAVDHRKLLYASDYPLRLYPRRQAEPDFRPFLAEIAGLDLAADVRADILGLNAARLLGLLAGEPTAAVEKPGRKTRAAIAKVTAETSVAAIASAFPETIAIFERYGIAAVDTPVPEWEPVGQAGAARGLAPEVVARLLRELSEAITN
jgi:predicted TIM-barrel fold metal-dependent hydrolase